ncbi:MAG: 16S rRNA (guanine(966)-N(2))-methyltransferase RsmD [candidate division Zixibacteria bacterium]
MSLKITGGHLKGRIIKTSSGRDTRPTLGRVREAIFSMIQHDIEDADILDLFAGSGALAIEALSRGAASAILIEKNRKTTGIIKTNLDSLELRARILNADYIKAFQILKSESKRFDIIFADPPYDLIEPDRLASEISEYSLIKPGGLFILEHAGNIVPEDVRKIKTRRFGDSAVSVFHYE